MNCLEIQALNSNLRESGWSTLGHTRKWAGSGCHTSGAKTHCCRRVATTGFKTDTQ